PVLRLADEVELLLGLVPDLGEPKERDQISGQKGPDPSPPSPPSLCAFAALREPLCSAVICAGKCPVRLAPKTCIVLLVVRCRGSGGTGVAPVRQSCKEPLKV